MSLSRNTYIEFGKANDSSIDYLVGILSDARITTLQRVTNIGLEELHWQFATGWNTIGALLSHIISTENYFRIEFLEERALAPEETKKWIPGLEMGKYLPQLIDTSSLDVYVAALKESREQLLHQLLQLDRDAFFRKREGYNKETGFNLAWALYHMAEDEVHHRGQISMIRKLFSLRNSL